MCYIITLEDGSFIIFDGGGNSSTYDAQRLHETLQSLNKRSGKPVIAAWILTHVHWDHHSNFNAFANRYGSQYILEYAIHNAPAESYALSDGFDQYFNKTYMKTISCFDGDKKIVKAHTGMKFNLHGAEFEVLYSHEDCYPQEVKYFNNTTLVTRMTLAGQTFMWLAMSSSKAARYSWICMATTSRVILSRSRITASAMGGSQDLYKLIDADVALWPCEQWAYDTRPPAKLARRLSLLLAQYHRAHRSRWSDPHAGSAIYAHEISESKQKAPCRTNLSDRELFLFARDGGKNSLHPGAHIFLGISQHQLDAIFLVDTGWPPGHSRWRQC